MITFAHGCLFCGKSKSNQKGLTPAIGASPDFVCPAQKSFIGQPKISGYLQFKRRQSVPVINNDNEYARKQCV